MGGGCGSAAANARRPKPDSHQQPLPPAAHVHQHARHALELAALQGRVVVAGAADRRRLAGRGQAARGDGAAARHAERAHPHRLHRQLKLGQAAVAQAQVQGGPLAGVGVAAAGAQLPLLPRAHVLAVKHQAVGAALARLQEAVAHGGAAEAQPLALLGRGVDGRGVWGGQWAGGSSGSSGGASTRERQPSTHERRRRAGVPGG